MEHVGGSISLLGLPSSVRRSRVPESMDFSAISSYRPVSGRVLWFEGYFAAFPGGFAHVWVRWVILNPRVCRTFRGGRGVFFGPGDTVGDGLVGGGRGEVCRFWSSRSVHAGRGVWEGDRFPGVFCVWMWRIGFGPACLFDILFMTELVSGARALMGAGVSLTGVGVFLCLGWDWVYVWGCLGGLL